MYCELTLTCNLDLTDSRGNRTIFSFPHTSSMVNLKIPQPKWKCIQNHLSLKSDCSTRELTTKAHTGLPPPSLEKLHLAILLKRAGQDKFSEEPANVNTDLHPWAHLFPLCRNHRAFQGSALLPALLPSCIFKGLLLLRTYPPSSLCFQEMSNKYPAIDTRASWFIL